MVSKRWFWLAVAVQVLLLLGLVGRHAYTVTTGTPIVLQTEPVDPWDPFRGEYVRLNYTISRADITGPASNGGPFKAGQQVWVVLRPEDGLWQFVSVHATRPTVPSGQVALKATVVNDPWYINGVAAPARLEYGIEQFYVPEGEGRKLEQAGGKRKLTVEVLVDSFGRAALHKVFVDGQEVRWR